jgi:hypothetical protein
VYFGLIGDAVRCLKFAADEGVHVAFDGHNGRLNSHNAMPRGSRRPYGPLKSREFTSLPDYMRAALLFLKDVLGTAVYRSGSRPVISTRMPIDLQLQRYRRGAMSTAYFSACRSSENKNVVARARLAARFLNLLTSGLESASFTARPRGCDFNNSSSSEKYRKVEPSLYGSLDFR